MSDLINVPSYWPLFINNEKRRFYYTSADGSLEPMTSIFRYDDKNKCMLYEDYNAAGEWQDTWFYYVKSGYGIAEFRDDYPQKDSTLKRIFGPTKKIVMSEPIGWGDKLPVGGVYQNNPKFDFFKCCPPQTSTG